MTEFNIIVKDDADFDAVAAAVERAGATIIRSGRLRTIKALRVTFDGSADQLRRVEGVFSVTISPRARAI